MTTNGAPVQFSDALVSEIKAEMGRQDMSSRALGRLIGASAQYISSRLDGGNPRTGERVVLTVRDLAAIAQALGLDEIELISRAQEAASRKSNVIPMRQDADLYTADIEEDAAASTDDSAPDPQRGES